MAKQSEIKISVTLDENKVPEKLSWSAEDGGIKDEQTQALLLSVWDSVDKECLRIDLWTKDMPIEEMQEFFYQTIVSLSNTYKRATQDEKVAQFLVEMGEQFATLVNEAKG